MSSKENTTPNPNTVTPLTWEMMTPEQREFYARSNRDPDSAYRATSWGFGLIRSIGAPDLAMTTYDPPW